MTVPGSTVVGDHASIPAEGLCVMSIWPALSVATQRAGDAQEIPAIQCPGSTGEMCQPAGPPPRTRETRRSPLPSPATHSWRDGQDSAPMPAMPRALMRQAPPPPGGASPSGSAPGGCSRWVSPAQPGTRRTHQAARRDREHRPPLRGWRARLLQLTGREACHPDMSASATLFMIRRSPAMSPGVRSRNCAAG